MIVPKIVVDPPSKRPDMIERNIARKISSNKIIPKINSVSVFAVLFKSTKTLATMAEEETLRRPAIMNVSIIGKPTANPYTKPKMKLRAT